MSRYYRSYKPGGTFFFTLVTEKRRSFLTTRLARNNLRQAFREIKKRHPFEIVAIVLMPKNQRNIHPILSCFGSC